MRITTQGEYGLRCVLYIIGRRVKGPVSIAEISREESLPRSYVEQLLIKLRRSGILESVRGVNGGYKLAKDPSKITIKDIIVALEGDTFKIICTSVPKKGGRCKHFNRCNLRQIWKQVRESIDRILEKSLEDLKV
jgi:Rrf2 family protein